MRLAHSRLNQHRLGNMLWAIAGTIGLSRTHNASAVFPASWEYRRFFSIPDEMFSDTRGATEVMELAPHLHPSLGRPYLQDVSLFLPVLYEIWDYFQPSPVADSYLESDKYAPFHDILEPRIALHVRRADNLREYNPATSGYHPLRSLSYYKRAVDMFPDAAVVVFSDDQAWCKEYLPKALNRDCYFVEGVSRPAGAKNGETLDCIDLFLMSLCEHHIIANSSYSYWGAMLSDDESPVYPSNWYGYRIAPYVDASLMFPENWIQLHDMTCGGLHERQESVKQEDSLFLEQVASCLE